MQDIYKKLTKIKAEKDKIEEEVNKLWKKHDELDKKKQRLIAEDIEKFKNYHENLIKDYTNCISAELSCIVDQKTFIHKGNKVDYHEIYSDNGLKSLLSDKSVVEQITHLRIATGQGTNDILNMIGNCKYWTNLLSFSTFYIGPNEISGLLTIAKNNSLQKLESLYLRKNTLEDKHFKIFCDQARLPALNYIDITNYDLAYPYEHNPYDGAYYTEPINRYKYTNGIVRKLLSNKWPLITIRSHTTETDYAGGFVC